MPEVKFYHRPSVPMEMHKVKIVQKLTLLPARERLQKMREANFNAFMLHNKDIFVDMNIRPPFYSDESILFALSNATLLKISDEELAQRMAAFTPKTKELSGYLKRYAALVSSGAKGAILNV